MCKEEDNSTAYTKVINSESASYRPILTDTLVLDAVPTVNSFNSVTSDAVARAVAGASGEVPQVTENDNGKILTAIYDAGGPAVEWGEAPNAVPAVTENDNAKVLTATYSEGTGSFAWATPSGGGVTKQVISLTGGTFSQGTTTTTFTFNLAAANQFYALGKQVSVSYKPKYFPYADLAGSKIKLYYNNTYTITLDATTYSNIFCASVFVGNEENSGMASDPSLGYAFNKVEIVVPISGSNWGASPEAESLQIQILG